MKSGAEIQQRIFELIKMQLSKDESLAHVISETLFLSQDAVYRRLRGDVELTISEIHKLCETFNISFDALGDRKANTVEFSYNPSVDRYAVNFESYLTGLRENLRKIKSLDNPHLITSVNDTPLFQMFNLPDLTRFKFFFWSKTYLNNPAFADLKFGPEKIENDVLQISIDALNLYNSIPSTEIYCPETLRGTLRQIEYYFDARLFEEPEYAFHLLDSLNELLDHMKKQAEVGRKFPIGNEPVTSGNEFHIYSNDTYIYDNTYFFRWEQGSAVYFSHNIMNYLTTADPAYTNETKLILDELLDNSSIISKANKKERNRFFGNLERSIQTLRKKIELELA